VKEQMNVEIGRIEKDAACRREEWHKERKV
jgi:hypothetical protein